MYRLLTKTYKDKSILKYIFLTSIFFAFHYAFVTYINSTLLEGIAGRALVGVFYALSAILTIFGFIYMPRITRRIGNYKLILALSLLEILSLSLLAFIESPILLILTFMVHHAVNPFIFLCLDVGIEELADQKSMGKIRGFFLTITSVAFVVSPFVTGTMVQNFGLTSVYAMSLIFMTIFLLFALRNLRDIPNGTYRKVNPRTEFIEFLKQKSIRRIGQINLLLQLFYAFMIIYVPIYLIEIIGFTWSELGLILCIALIPFVLLDSPVGELADQKYGEKEFLITGFSIMVLVTGFIAFLDSQNLFVWASLLFLSRVGASITDVSAETYFFKKSKGKDELIGIYRTASPLAYIIGPLLGSVTLTFISFNYIFLLLSVILILGIVVASQLKDTR